jgi:CheY-like chemotaxis protein
MPVMDGISCVKFIREFEQQHNLKRTPIIIQTGNSHKRKKQTENECSFVPPFLDS